MNDKAFSLNFRSDNVGTVTPEILRALHDVNHGPAASYGDDENSALLKQKFCELFETEVTVCRSPAAYVHGPPPIAMKKRTSTRHKAAPRRRSAVAPS